MSWALATRISGVRSVSRPAISRSARLMTSSAAWARLAALSRAASPSAVTAFCASDTLPMLGHGAGWLPAPVEAHHRPLEGTQVALHRVLAVRGDLLLF